VINNTEPRWTKNPSELTDDDYRQFYHELYPGQDDPLFWIHLNVDYPFTLTGILFFPKIKNNFEITKNRIQLYCNQVYVTDSVEGVVPEFMMLLQGVIDSPDIPLNVSRSYLQSDAAVKKISSYITKKVASRLEDLFKNDRADFESKWDDIKIFIEYGMLTDEKFCDSAMKFTLLKDTEGKHFTLDEYRKLIEGEQTDKESTVVYLYATDTEKQYSFIDAAKAKGYSVLLMDGQLDSHFIGLLERKIEKSRFVRVDSDIIENLIPKTEKRSANLSENQRVILTDMMKSRLPQLDKINFLVSFEALGMNNRPVVITQDEYMRRMKEMAAMQPGMSFYGEMPDSYNIVVNTENPTVLKVQQDAEAALSAEVEPLTKIIDEGNATVQSLRDKKDAESEQTIKDTEKAISEARDKRQALINDYAAKQDTVKQLIDLALLSTGLLKGQALSDFVNRSFSLL
jgi:molecular chaperone HtpG